MAWVSSQHGGLGTVRRPMGQLKAPKANISAKKADAVSPFLTHHWKSHGITLPYSFDDK